MARLDPYRIDWRSPDGRWILGKPMPLPVARITEADKRAFRDRVAPSWKRIGQSPDTISEWPDVLPPYATGGMVGGPYGVLLVRKQPSAGQAPEMRYDVIDRRGVLLGQLTLPANQRIVSSGEKSLYVVEKHSDDIERLRRFAWPAELRITP